MQRYCLFFNKHHLYYIITLLHKLRVRKVGTTQSPSHEVPAWQVLLIFQLSNRSTTTIACFTLVSLVFTYGPNEKLCIIYMGINKIQQVVIKLGAGGIN